jgi:hypothetical protein
MGAYVGRSLKHGGGPLLIRDRGKFFSVYKYRTCFSDLCNSRTSKLSKTPNTLQNVVFDHISGSYMFISDRVIHYITCKRRTLEVVKNRSVIGVHTQT